MSRKNSLVSTKFKLTKDDSMKISLLTIRTGKAAASGRKKTTSGVWKYFGVLCTKSSNDVCLDTPTPSTSTG